MVVFDSLQLSGVRPMCAVDPEALNFPSLKHSVAEPNQDGELKKAFHGLGFRVQGLGFRAKVWFGLQSCDTWTFKHAYARNPKAPQP